jgi:hypothetical protein
MLNYAECLAVINPTNETATDVNRAISFPPLSTKDHVFPSASEESPKLQ